MTKKNRPTIAAILLKSGEQKRRDKYLDALMQRLPLGASEQPVDTTQEGHKRKRRAMVDAYISEVLKKTGQRITRTDIWKKAGYKSRTEFERWQLPIPIQPARTNRRANDSPVSCEKNRT